MKDCHDDVLSYHNDEVTLGSEERAEMRTRRNANRNRLTAGLIRDEEPLPFDQKSQGSYAMRSMVQDSAKDYAIDDGEYFTRAALKGPRGGDRSAADAKEMVRKAVHSDTFKKPPEVKTNCVRVYYNEGYHVDIPVYRQYEIEISAGTVITKLELASTDWKTSNPIAVTDWFDEENRRQSPDQTNGRQLRRHVRYLKKFARSRDSWKSRIASGFMITKLVVECYQANEKREDCSLYDTMVAIRDRLLDNLEIDHPTVEGEKLTKGPWDAKARFLREKLTEAIDNLDVLFDVDCTREQALKAWDKVFNTKYFSDRLSSDSQSKAQKVADSKALIREANQPGPASAVNKRGGGQYA